MRHLRYINLGLKIARQNLDIYPHSVGAVIVKGGRIIGFGNNRYQNGMHAETSAIMKNRRTDLRGAILYVSRALRAKPCGISKPCPECQKVIKQYGISKVYYTTDDMNNIYEEMIFQ